MTKRKDEDDEYGEAMRSVAESLRAETHMRGVAQSSQVTPKAWLVTAGSNSEFHLLDNERHAKLVRKELEENGWLDVALTPLYASQPPAAQVGRYYCQTCCGTGKYNSRMCGLPPEADTTCVDCGGTGTEPAAPVETLLRDTLIAAQVALAYGAVERTPFVLDALERIDEALAMVKAAPDRCSAGNADAAKAFQDLEIFIGEVDELDAAGDCTIDSSEAAAALAILRLHLRAVPQRGQD